MLAGFPQRYRHKFAGLPIDEEIEAPEPRLLSSRREILLGRANGAGKALDCPWVTTTRANTSLSRDVALDAPCDHGSGEARPVAMIEAVT